MEVKITDQEIVVEVKVFTDDFQDAIRNFDQEGYTYEGDITFVQDNAENVTSYFGEHLRMDDGRISLSFQKSELVGDSYWITLSAKLETDLRSLDIAADYFMELFPTQQNIVIAAKGTLKRSCRLTKQAPQCTLHFSED